MTSDASEARTRSGSRRSPSASEPSYGVDVLEIKNGKIVRETIYVGEPFDAPEWRAQWRVAP